MGFFAHDACANTALEIKPVEIAVFNDARVFAMDKSGKYQIGQVGGKWSEVNDIRNLGLSLLDVFVATKEGMFLIGSESRLDSDKSTYYTTLIVLIDSGNKNIKQWRHEANFFEAIQ